MTDFEYIEIPPDEADPRYVKSFDVLEGDTPVVQEFFEVYGFVVFRNVITPECCCETIADMWNLLEECTPGLDQNDSDSWSRGWTAFGMPKSTPRHVIFRPSLLRSRQDANVVQCFRNILKTPTIISSHDRWLMHRPAILDNGAVYRSDWGTKPNVHLDLNPVEFFDPQCGKEVNERLSALRYSERKIEHL